MAGFTGSMRWARVLVAFVAVAACALLPARAQDTVDQTRQAAAAALSRGAYSEAIPLLQQLVTWLGASKTDGIINEMEAVYYNLGMCHFLVGEFNEARAVFEVYVKKYAKWPRAALVDVYIGDTLRFQGKLPDAFKHYQRILKIHVYDDDWTADILVSMSRCLLADENWTEASPLLTQVIQLAPDFARRNWAASMLCVSYLKNMDMDNFYRMMPYLLHPESYASRSVALNLAALEAGDELFADERFREALWVYRIVYPKDRLVANNEAYQLRLQRLEQRMRRYPSMFRQLMRVLENQGEVEQHLKALKEVKAYDTELAYRIARAYFESRRFRESGDLFYHLYQKDIPEKAEECLYLSFLSYSQIPPWERAIELGDEYMTKYSGGQFYDTVSLSLAQIHANKKDWKSVIRVVATALEVHPKHEQIVECLFLLGYACFMEERFPEAQQHLGRMLKEFPNNDREIDGTYWLGMSFLFDRKYEEAIPPFDRVIKDLGENPFLEDARFRRASCDFALSAYDEAEAKLLAFEKDYPRSVLMGETLVMLGDIAGVYGDLPVAVERYQRTPGYEINVEQYNYAMFRCGEMLDEMKRYDDLVAHFQSYIQRNREDSNIPLALYWVGSAMWKKGEQEPALAYWREAIVKFGPDRRALGLDLLMDEWVARARDAKPETAKAAWKGMHELLAAAEAKKQTPLVLRLRRLLSYEPDALEAEQRSLRRMVVQEANLPHASASILEFILDQAEAATNHPLALKAAQALVAEFPETDAALAARMLLAKEAREAGNFDEAIKHLDIIREVFATSGEAGEALLMLGDLYLERKDWAKADEMYTQVLGVKEWKPMWPPALYGRGEIARGQKQFDKAAAFYERIYVLYAGHARWVPKAYLARAECLRRLGEIKKARETLEEMLKIPDIDQAPETPEAKAMLEDLKQRV